MPEAIGPTATRGELPDARPIAQPAPTARQTVAEQSADAVPLSSGAVQPAPTVDAAVADPTRHSHGHAARVATIVVAVIAAGTVLSLAREVFFPIVAAALLAMLLSPIVAQIERLHLPRIGASLVVMLFVIALLFLAIDALLEPLARALDALPAMQGLVRRTLRVARLTMGAPFADWLGARFDEWTAAGKGAASGALFTRLLSASVGTATVLVLAFFLLASGDLFLQKLIRVIPRIRDKVNALKIVRTVQEEVSRYLLTVTMINAALGIVVGSVCWYFGLPNAILWGTLVGVLNFIPYVGPFVNLCLLTTAAAAHFSSLADILLIPVAFAGITLVEGQVLTPMIVGRRVELNPVVVFVGLLLWFWLWGVPGMIVAIPLLIIAKVWAQHTEAMAAWAEFLGA
ncbi:MAG: AI-2E family transporter [Pseudomonadota bacterium]|nr:AI-2E family transporter [Pseudomonadota bacterium]